MRTDFTELANQGSAWTRARRLILDRGVEAAVENPGDCIRPDLGRRGSVLPGRSTAVSQFLDNAPYRRIEATVDVGFNRASLDQMLSV